MGLRVWYLGFRAKGFVFWVEGVGCRVKNFRFRVQGVGCRVSGVV